VVQWIPVPFHGTGSGSAELTWGQLSVWRTIKNSGATQTMGGIMPLPPGTTVQDAAAVLRFVLSRHQSLRTRLRFEPDGSPRQVLVESGEARLELVEAGDADPAEVAEDVRIRYSTTNFDYVNEWPVRMAVVTSDGVPAYSVAVYCHLAIDAQALDILIADLATMDPVTGEGATPVTAIQPLELARRQHSAAGQRQTDLSLRHWAKVLRSASPRRFNVSTDPRQPRFWDLAYRSPATHLAVRVVAARTNSDTTAVLLAGFAVALAQHIGINPVLCQLAVGNRFRPGLADSVTPLAQSSPCAIDVANQTFDQAVATAVRAAMSTYLCAYYDPNQRAALVASLNAERGAKVDLDCYFNDRRLAGKQPTDEPLPTAELITEALAHSELRWETRTDVDSPRLYLDVDDADDGLRFTMTADTHCLSPDEMCAVVRAVEATVVRAALEPTMTTDVVAEASA
jgi:hypothetical protein